VIRLSVVARANGQLRHAAPGRVHGDKDKVGGGLRDNGRHGKHDRNEVLGEAREVVVLYDARELLHGRGRIGRVQELEALALFGAEPVRRLLDVVALNLLVSIELSTVLADHLTVANPEKGLPVDLEVDEL
jgi:hypothetical protein